MFKNYISNLLKENGINIELTVPPSSGMGDFCIPCFELATGNKQNLVELAKDLALKINNYKLKEIDRVRAVGPYVNIFVNSKFVAKIILKEVVKDDFGKNNLGEGKKWLVEFGCPNPMKVFHLGHLKNLITGESVSRILDNAGYKVIRVNYQGDVGLHQAKAIWALINEKLKVKSKKFRTLREKVEYLGKMYAKGTEAYGRDEQTKKEILEMNEKIYEKDESIMDVYEQARDWSLEYFDSIYKKLDTHFDKLYFESDMFERGLEIVKENLKNNIFEKSQGAIIFVGSKYNLHDRVFVNSKGYPTYEAKDLALAEKHFKDYNPDNIIHVVGKEQTDYFKVVFTAMDKIWPGLSKKEYHLVGGYLQLKGQQKMSSRTGNVISGDELIKQTEDKVKEIMTERELDNKKEIVRKITNAVLKYAMLKSNVSQDVGFDMETSVSLSGDSGPYLLYIVARIKSILRKIESDSLLLKGDERISFEVSDIEKQLLLKLAEYPEVTRLSAQNLDPAKISQYLFSLAQKFNVFYDNCPILQEENEEIKLFRIKIIQAVEKIMINGLNLLGISVVDEM